MRRTMTAVRLNDGERITVDGRMDESVWSRVEPAADFVQSDPGLGSPASEHTEVRIAYNDRALYMAVVCFDSEPTRLLRFQRRRDEFLQADDRFQWVFDPFLTGQNGYFFETNPSGAMSDALMGINGQNRQWDGIWNERVQRHADNWTVEIEIPFRTLNFSPTSDTCHNWLDDPLRANRFRSIDNRLSSKLLYTYRF